MSDSVTPWPVAHQALLAMGFSKQEYWSGLPLPTLGDFPHPGIKPMLLVSSALAGGFSGTEPPGKSELKLREANSLVHSHPADKWLSWKLDCRRSESSVCVPNLAAYLGAADTRRDSSQSVQRNQPFHKPTAINGSFYRLVSVSWGSVYSLTSHDILHNKCQVD